MEQNVILLNGGQDYDVEPFASADAYLVRLLGSEPARRAVMYLRSMQDAEGRPRAAVFVGNHQVGYLPLDTDETVLITIRACEMHGAVARARGTLTTSWEQPGKVQIKVNLADPDDLLSNSAQPAAAEPAAMVAPEEVPAPQTIEIPAVENQAGVNDAAYTLSSSFEDAAAFIDLDEPQEAPSPSGATPSKPDHADSADLSAGWTEDYPEWSPLRPKPSATAKSVLQDQPAMSHQPTAPAGPALTEESASPEALLATRSAWTPTPDQPEPPKPDWLTSKTQPASQPGTPDPAESPPPDPEAGSPQQTTR